MSHSVHTALTIHGYVPSVYSSIYSVYTNIASSYTNSCDVRLSTSRMHCIAARHHETETCGNAKYKSQAVNVVSSGFERVEGNTPIAYRDWGSQEMSLESVQTSSHLCASSAPLLKRLPLTTKPRWQRLWLMLGALSLTKSQFTIK